MDQVISVRRATPQDAQAMMEIHLGCIDKIYSFVYSETALRMWKSLLELDYYVAKTQSPGWCYVAVIEAEYGEQVVGFGYLNTNTQQPPRIPVQYGCDLQIESLYVSVNHHKCGIGQKLLQEIERKALDQNSTRIAILSSITAVPFYKRQGYTVVENSVWFNIQQDTYSKSIYSVEAEILVKDFVSD